MRVLLFTGKGGVGKTTASAATATLAAGRGLKTLVVSTDPAHSLADAVDAPLGPEPTEIDGGLYGQQIDAQRSFERSWREVQDYLMTVLARSGIDPMAAEELTVLPGAEEVMALLEVRAQVTSGRWDLVVVDCAPTADTLRLLALPEALSWYMDRVFPVGRRVARAMRPVLARTALPVPQDRVFAAVERLHAELSEVRALLTDPQRSTVRLVLTPEAVVVAEARRTLTSLSLYGYRVDGVVANRVFPAGGDAWRAGWVAAQAIQLDEVRQSFAPLPVWLSPYRAGEPVGLEELAAFGAEAYGATDPLALPPARELMSVTRTETGFDLALDLPLADKRDLDLVRKGDELVVTVGSRRRVLALPSALRRCAVSGAALAEGRLVVSFAPDPEQWSATP
ncbi:MAG: arsenite/tail-anchored protein-transporting ATPase [Frankiaceae bacterium]|nr:arsenite/tail-anchored protein-transporting ATPase [Frankiaceae bacterium]